MPNLTFAVAVCLSLFADETSSNNATRPPSSPPAALAPPTGGGSFSPAPPTALPQVPSQRPVATNQTPAVSPANGAVQPPPTSQGGGRFSLPPTSPTAPLTPVENNSRGFQPPSTGGAPVLSSVPGSTLPGSTLPGSTLPGSTPQGLTPQATSEATPLRSENAPTTHFSQPIDLPLAHREPERTAAPQPSTNRLSSSADGILAAPAASLEVDAEPQLEGAFPANQLQSSSPTSQGSTRFAPNSLPLDAAASGETPQRPASLSSPGTTQSNTETSRLPNFSNQQLSGPTTVAPPVSPPTDVEKASLSLARSLLENAEQQTALRQRNETTLSLLEALTATQEAGQRKLIIQRYWCVAITNLNLTHALEEREILQGVEATTREDQTALNAALQIAKTRVVDLQVQLQQAQFDLIEIMGRGTIEQAPWPIDTPFIGRYRTNYERYTEFRTMPREIARIHHSLPLMLELIEARAEAIAALDQQVLSTTHAYRLGQTHLAQVLASLETLSQQRMSMLASIQDYNQMISNYALTVAPQGLAPESVVPMLIKTSTPSLARGESNIRRTNFQAPGDTVRPTPRASSNWHSIVPR